MHAVYFHDTDLKQICQSCFSLVFQNKTVLNIISDALNFDFFVYVNYKKSSHAENSCGEIWPLSIVSVR